MPKANLPAPRVFVVPELMPGGPLEKGGLLSEYLEARRLSATSSARERIEAYLEDPGVARKPPGATWPSVSQLEGMSGVERQRWSTWDMQHWVDSRLRKILGGK